MRQTTGGENEPRPPTEELIRLLSRFDLRVGELALALRQMLLEEAPTANEKLFDGYALAMSYSFTDRWMDGFCHIAVYARHVNLGFNRGAELDDPERVLVGDGKIIRHIKVHNAEDLKSPHLRRFVRAAIRNWKDDRPARPRRAKTKARGPSALKRRRSDPQAKKE
jgi:hypothetical protein